MSADPPIAAPLAREHMPADYSISLEKYTNRGTSGERRIPDDFGPRQSLRGFEQTYHNIIDYIVRITYRIWEDRDVQYIADTYSDNSQVFDDYGLQRGCQKIIQDTQHTTSAFSDIKLIADEIVWAGDDEVGYHTSHRTIIRGTNDGDSKYGPATNRNIDVLVIANCVALDNEIFLEHVLYNNSSMLQQLGHSLSDIVATLSKSPPAGWPRDADTWDNLRRAARPDQPISIAQPIDGFDVDKFARATLHQLWNGRDYSALSSAYVPDFAFQGATDRRFRGAAPYQTLLSSIATAFPDLELQVDEVYWMGNDKDGYLTSERWSAEGTHSGAGIYGEPSGKSVQIWGITQHHIVDGKIVAEWMLFNELDLMMQLAASQE
ncbi:MAG: ester cyclase [Gammaproteobacteria bacterium]|nr:ester cyclase [Gammaproteobacteria bacterium]